MFECLQDFLRDREFILKKELRKYTGGVISEYTFSNLEKKNIDELPEKIVIGNKVAYRTKDIVEWLEKNAIEIK